MCGVIGFSTRDLADDDVLLLRELFLESRIRGLHAFGFSVEIRTPNAVGWQRSTFKSSSLDETLENIEGLSAWEGSGLRFVGHTRYSTSGPPENVENNQPLVKGNVALAFNGVLDQRSKEERERSYGRSFETDNDGELFIDRVQAARNLGKTWDESAEEALAATTGSFAGVFLGGKGFLVAIRNEARPLRRAGSFLFSTADIGRRALGNEGELLEPGRAYLA